MTLAGFQTFQVRHKKFAGLRLLDLGKYQSVPSERRQQSQDEDEEESLLSKDWVIQKKVKFLSYWINTFQSEPSMRS